VYTVRNGFVALAAALLLGACSTAPKNRLASAPQGDYSLSVTNHNWLDVTVFVIRGGTRFRVGDVSGNSSARLKIPGRLVESGAVQLLVDPIGSSEYYLTDPIMVTSDEGVQLTVAPAMRMSTYAVLNR
jgi:hypothetical protein